MRNALEVTFEQRKRQPLPSSLLPPPTNWEEPYRRLATEVGVEPDLGRAFADAGAFLDPILAGRTDGEWDPQRQIWV